MSTTEPDRPDSPETGPSDPVSQGPQGSGRPALLEIGRVAKPHGLSGEVVVDLVTQLSSRLDPGSVLSTSESSELVVAGSRPFGRRWIVVFEGVDDREAAEQIRGWRLLAEPVEDPGALWVDELVGAIAEDQTGRRLGTVAAVVANPASDLLELDGGGLIPLVFVVEHGAGKVVVDIPEGLIE